MAALRANWRPSLRELKSFVLPPSNPHAKRCVSQMSRKATSNHRNALNAVRTFSISSHPSASSKPKSHDRGPISQEDTQTDFGSMNVLGNTPAPSTSIDATAWDGFHLNSGVKIVGGTGMILVAGEAFMWKPWESANGSLNLVNSKGQFDVEDEAWGLLSLVWPKPDLLILGLGKEMRPISPKIRKYINSLGIRVDVSDTRNAAAQFNLLATERGVGSVAGAFIPIGWKEGVGVKFVTTTNESSFTINN